jgi:hypothetical protein
VCFICEFFAEVMVLYNTLDEHFNSSFSYILEISGPSFKTKVKKIIGLLLRKMVNKYSSSAHKIKAKRILSNIEWLTQLIHPRPLGTTIFSTLNSIKINFNHKLHKPFFTAQKLLSH